MDQINNYQALTQFNLQKQIDLKAEKATADVDKNEQKLNKIAEDFSAIFIGKMLSAMKKTLPDKKMIDGGFAEDIFSDMMYQEYSKMAAKQGLMSNLNQALVEQLKKQQS
ncbi:rod-binding protein [Halanaerobium salsuginis]|jgi:flagellar protein FlgJ|uniref:Flagellar protein FlgJ n=1 Tax=Halanaerobium salsuginis TaxID=29563 RepID=A0A1I4KJI9_9FIRM|nr:rod-binding protein [Halanaerobium salsuginis]SFL78980.1 flagellar protein FlgJ [Halanaerobium salsuginis]